MVFKHALFMRGFTLIEVIVTMFILGILAAILVVQLYDNDPEEELDRNARAVVNVLQLARSYATSGHNSTSGINGYGVYCNATDYYIYADQDDDEKYDSAEVVSSYALEQNNGFDGNYDIFFSLNDAAAYSNGVTLLGSSKQLILEHAETVAVKTIIIQGSTSAISYVSYE